MREPVPDLDLAAGLFRAVHDDSRDGAGVTRDAYGPGEHRAHDRIAAEGQRLGLERHVDYAGNLALTLPGRDRSRRLIFDSQGAGPDRLRSRAGSTKRNSPRARAKSTNLFASSKEAFSDSSSECHWSYAALPLCQA